MIFLLFSVTGRFLVASLCAKRFFFIGLSVVNLYLQYNISNINSFVPHLRIFTDVSNEFIFSSVYALIHVQTLQFTCIQLSAFILLFCCFYCGCITIFPPLFILYLCDGFSSELTTIMKTINAIRRK